MNARQRAERIAAQVQRERAANDATARVVPLPLLGLVVKNGEVYARKFTDRHLDPLAGACAGVMDIRPGSDAAYLAAAVVGLSSPRVGTDLRRWQTTPGTRPHCVWALARR